MYNRYTDNLVNTCVDPVLADLENKDGKKSFFRPCFYTYTYKNISQTILKLTSFLFYIKQLKFHMHSTLSSAQLCVGTISLECCHGYLNGISLTWSKHMRIILRILYLFA